MLQHQLELAFNISALYHDPILCVIFRHYPSNNINPKHGTKLLCSQSQVTINLPSISWKFPSSFLVDCVTSPESRHPVTALMIKVGSKTTAKSTNQR
jgi:hypothetical protein